MAIIEVERVSKYFKTFRRREGLRGAILDLFHRDVKIVKAVDEVSFSIPQGEIVGYIGPNGAGKSTTLKMLVGILTPSKGSIKVAGLDPFKDRKLHCKQIGVVFGQRSQLWWNLAVIESFELLRRIYDVPKADYKRRLEEFDEVLEIDEFLHLPLRELSLGQRTRCELAASLLHNPAVIFLDEPTIGLDVAVKARIREFIKAINQTYNTTVILASHDLNDIEDLAGRILVIDQGRIIFDGSLQDLRTYFEEYEKTIVLEFAEAIDDRIIDSLSQGIKTQKEDAFHLILKLNSRAHTTELVAELLDKYPLRDLLVEEPRIEDIVLGIYKKRREGGKED
jgi:ABC-2 type transport system ATP-binding protein